MPPWLRIYGAIIGTALSACSSIPAQDTLPTATAVDLTRYAGTWYEIARLPLWFQRHCVDSKTRYSIRIDGKVDVHDECLTGDGGTDEANGVATVVDPKTNAKLKVVFNNWFARVFGAPGTATIGLLSWTPSIASPWWARRTDAISGFFPVRQDSPKSLM